MSDPQDPTRSCCRQLVVREVGRCQKCGVYPRFYNNGGRFDGGETALSMRRRVRASVWAAELERPCYSMTPRRGQASVSDERERTIPMSPPGTPNDDAWIGEPCMTLRPPPLILAPLCVRHHAVTQQQSIRSQTASFSSVDWSTAWRGQADDVQPCGKEEAAKTVTCRSVGAVGFPQRKSPAASDAPLPWKQDSMMGPPPVS